MLYFEWWALRLLRVSCLLRTGARREEEREGGSPILTLTHLTAPILQQGTASGLLYLHSVSIVHRDVKPGNILVDAKNKIAKVADYGISRVVDATETMTLVGTPLYQAPEISRGERYGFAADVYSFALTMYAVCDRVGLLVFASSPLLFFSSFER